MPPSLLPGGSGAHCKRGVQKGPGTGPGKSDKARAPGRAERTRLGCRALRTVHPSPRSAHAWGANTRQDARAAEAGRPVGGPRGSGSFSNVLSRASLYVPQGWGEGADRAATSTPTEGYEKAQSAVLTPQGGAEGGGPGTCLGFPPRALLAAEEKAALFEEAPGTGVPKKEHGPSAGDTWRHPGSLAATVGVFLGPWLVTDHSGLSVRLWDSGSGQLIPAPWGTRPSKAALSVPPHGR